MEELLTLLISLGNRCSRRRDGYFRRNRDKYYPRDIDS